MRFAGSAQPNRGLYACIHDKRGFHRPRRIGLPYSPGRPSQKRRGYDSQPLSVPVSLLLPHPLRWPYPIPKSRFPGSLTALALRHNWPASGGGVKWLSPPPKGNISGSHQQLFHVVDSYGIRVMHEGQR